MMGLCKECLNNIPQCDRCNNVIKKESDMYTTTTKVLIYNLILVIAFFIGVIIGAYT